MHVIDANGADIPAIGLGTWTLSGKSCTELVAGALDAGYRHIDTAAMYGNETEVGEALRDSGLSRELLFVTTKVWHADLARDDLLASAQASLERLGLDHVDLLLIHWPPGDGAALGAAVRALNEARQRGLARNIGVSNFTSAQLAEAAEVSEQPLACNQCEYHPWLNQDVVLGECRRHGMAFVSYCPLSRAGAMFDEPPIRQAAERHNKTPAQIVLRWHVQQGVAALPRSTRLERVRENLSVFDFALSNDEMLAISALRSRQSRICDFDFSPDWDAA